MQTFKILKAWLHMLQIIVLSCFKDQYTPACYIESRG